MCLKRTEAMVTESEIEKNPFTDNITLLAEKLKQISLDCPGQFNIHSLKISSQFGCLRQHSLTNSHQVIHIQSLNYAPERSEKTMIKIQMPGIQMPIGDPLPIPIPKLSIGPLSDISREKCKQSAIRSKGATIESEKKEADLKAEKSWRETQILEETGHLNLPASQLFHCMFRNIAKNEGRDATFSFQNRLISSKA
ncbi:uncharacterized protein LOC120310111 isoform X2 [Crotalus tigris]|uniref:uncharacterized protein LOC120297652 isoform X2 n=1 Tax=Crotalus tigris TaxID=88082 RepID=UPI00192F57AB|nr:uncharacterized protein LOC120297652 isoform X2 [Crotalus tigris]XP_039204089.1 uncharacterized protein LOC120310111 isoform X2 [Crotalus tigris]